MPTAAEVKAELKSNGIKGYSGKKKAELYEMIKMLPIASSRRLLGPRTPAAPAVIADSMRKYEEAKERAKAAFEKLSEKKKIPSGPLAGGPELEHLERHVRQRVAKAVGQRVAKAVEEEKEVKKTGEEEKEVKKTGGGSDSVPKYIKSLKVGDTITYGRSSGYMGDGGDSRDVGYEVTRPIVDILPRNKYAVKGEYNTSKNVVFQLSKGGLWLTHPTYQVYYINDTRYTEKIRDEEEEIEENLIRAHRRKVAQRQAEKEKEDWTKGTAQSLRRTIEEHFAKQNRYITGLTGATKERLIGIIRKYEILK